MIYNFDDLMFQILTIDRFHHKDGRIYVKARPYAALSFREKGTGAFIIEGKSYHTKPGDVLFIPADTPYEVEYSTSDSIVVNMSFCNYSEVDLFDLQSQSGVSVMFTLMLEEWQKHHSVNQAKSTIYSILEKISKYNTEKSKNSTIANCTQYIEAHFCDPELDVKNICNVGFISTSNLYRLFLKNFGMAPKQYIIKLRMKKAIGLLAESELSIKEVSLLCGFSDDKYFSRAFKRKYGYSPSQLREKTHM